MKRLFAVTLALLLAAPVCFAGVELGKSVSLNLEGAVVSSASSADGSRIYLLTDAGKIMVLDKAGRVEGSVSVGRGYDSLTVLAGDANLLLSGKDKKSVEMVSLEIIHDIPIEDSPTMGDPDGRVAVVVFEDFQ